MLEYTRKKIFRNQDACRFVGHVYQWSCGYVLFMILVSLMTPFFVDYPKMSMGFILLECLIIFHQKFMSPYLKERYFGRFRIFDMIMRSDLHWAAWIWSAFALSVLIQYGMSGNGLIVVAMSVCMAGFSLGIYLPVCSLLRNHALILLAPIGVWGILAHTSGGLVVSSLVCFQLYFMIREKKKSGIHKLGMDCMNQRTSELVKINKELESEILYRKNMEKALRRSEERYRTLFQNNPIETIIVDHNGRITGYNSAKARSQGRVPEIGDIMYKDYGSRHANDMFEELMDCIRTGRQKEFPEQKYNERFLHIRISPYSGGAIITSLDITKSKRAEEQIQTLTREIMRVQENERKRIARDLHDSVAQDLSSLRISCETFFDGHHGNTGFVEKKIKEISKVLHGSINAVRDIAYELRPPCLDELGLPITLYRYCEEFTTRTDIQVDFFSAGLEQFRIDADSEINLYRLVQEALNNIRKHSQATRAVIMLVASYPYVILRIEDNGIGFEADLQANIGLKNSRMGLRSMEERVNLLGGKIELKSYPGKGTRVFVEVPIVKTNLGTEAPVESMIEM
jgi:PAS domain S-box-containing protein